MKTKLQHLTIAAMAIKSKCIPYVQLLDELEMTNVRALEDLIIETIYAGECFLFSFMLLLALRHFV